MVIIKNKFKTLKLLEPHKYFHELFESIIKEIEEIQKKSASCSYEMLETGEINWMDTILKHFNLFVNGTIKTNSNSKKFHDFISFAESELWTLGQCIYDIDMIKHYWDEHIPDSEKYWLLGNHMLQKLRILLTDQIMLRLSALFDREGYGKIAEQRNNLNERYNFISYKKELANIIDESQKSDLNFLQKFIDIIYEKINSWRKNFNAWKHNYSKNALNDAGIQKIPLQELFNNWYIMYAFILPMLKILHGYKKNNIFESFSRASISFETDWDDIYTLLKSFDQK